MSNEGREGRPTLLPGPTAALYYKKMNQFTIFLIMDFIAAFVFVGLSNMQRAVYIILFGITVVIAYAILVPFIRNAIRLKRATRREFAAGYSTLRTRKKGIWLLDPKTGEVLRGPNKN